MTALLGNRLDGPRFTRHRLTPAKRRVLIAMAGGEVLHLEAGAFRLDSGATVPAPVVRFLFDEGLVTEPLGELSLFGAPARPATITKCGRARLGLA
jgi:hypothetical protein